MWHTHLAHQIYHEHHPTPQYADQQRVFTRIILRDLCTQLGHARLELLFRNQHFLKNFLIAVLLDSFC